MTSSSEKVRHRSAETTTAGMSSGSVTRRNTRQRLAPRSAAASSSVTLIVEKRACMMIVAYAELNTTWPTTIAPTPSPIPSSLNRRNSPSANTTSGSTIRE